MWPENRIHGWTKDSLLLHDLGFIGDTVREHFVVLEKNFRVEIQDFDIGKYFPSELSLDSLIITIHPLLKYLRLDSLAERVLDGYPPFYLGWIEEAILGGKLLVYDGSI